MTDEIRAIIEKNLPAQVGEVLQKALRQGVADEIKVKECEVEIAALNKIIEQYRGKEVEYNKLSAKTDELNVLADKLDHIERSLDNAALKIQLEAEKDKSEFAKSVALGLVRNIEYRNVLSSSLSGDFGKDQYGNPIYNNRSSNMDEMKTAQ